MVCISSYFDMLFSGHTILIFQKSVNPNSRAWTEYDNVAMALEAIVSMFEKQLIETNPCLSCINYQVSDLISFISQCKEFAAFIFDSTINAYIPRDKAWIQEMTVSHLRRKLEPKKVDGRVNGTFGGKRNRYI
ncbi:13367_t:CDS:2 [Acaulospora morrowiae]|uniref:13367_t:CDS:1 n=1 Tax=Acaulospora morrowiae TaxID=94023 RepID=A0A9N9ATH2_9GLOM|nr:13367_t:CDS:2 [Acaulospora morrowiae]